MFSLQSFSRLFISLAACTLLIATVSFTIPTADAARADDFLGRGFGTDEEYGITRFDESAENQLVDQRGGGFAESGVRDINASLYTVKDFIKYAAGSIAILWLMISIFQLVTAKSDENIQSARKGLIWGFSGLLLVFVSDIAVISFFEGGSIKDVGTVGAAIADTETGQLNVKLVESIALYFQNDVRHMFEFLKVWGSASAILMMFAIGIWMVTAAGDEEAIEKGKSYITNVIIAFVVLLTLDTFIFQFIYPVDTITGLNSSECVEFLQAVTQDGFTDLSAKPAGCRSAMELGAAGSAEILGVIRFFETLMGSIAIFMLVYSGVRIIGSLGDEEVVTTHKKQVIWSLAGLMVILLSESVILRFFFAVDSGTGEISTNVTQGIYDITGIINFLITFIAVFSMVGLIAAGAMWVVNFGNEELTSKAKKIIIGSIVGIVISISAYAITNTLIAGKSNPTDTGISVDMSLPGADIHLGK